jgi:hypothetical protein
MDVKDRTQAMPADVDLSRMLPELRESEGRLAGPGLPRSLPQLRDLDGKVQELEKPVHELEPRLPK